MFDRKVVAARWASLVAAMEAMWDCRYEMDLDDLDQPHDWGCAVSVDLGPLAEAKALFAHDDMSGALAEIVALEQSMQRQVALLSENARRYSDRANTLATTLEHVDRLATDLLNRGQYDSDVGRELREILHPRDVMPAVVTAEDGGGCAVTLTVAPTVEGITGAVYRAVQRVDGDEVRIDYDHDGAIGTTQITVSRDGIAVGIFTVTGGPEAT